MAGLLTVVTLAPSSAASGSATYAATETIPVPPSSNYQGSGGGDGWAVALTSTAVYNVFHHSSSLTVACHLQSDASACWSPETITDPAGSGFETAGQPGLWMDQATGKLYVYASRASDGSGGVVCVDTTTAATNSDPFCGFTALTSAGEAQAVDGISAISDPALTGSKWYAFNYVPGAGTTGADNKLLCFDLATHTGCAGQPFGVNLGAGSLTNAAYPEPPVTAIGGRVFVAASIGTGDVIGCFDPTTSANCVGAWPISLGFAYASVYGTPFPLLTSSGAAAGLCLPNGPDPCYSLAGASIATPINMTSAIAATSGWNGPALTLGPRVYVPDGNANQVDCYDYATSTRCANFPKALPGLGLLYTVNADPARPTCIWVNSDNGTAQIQNFDAYTGAACGAGPIRVLASSMVVPIILCQPASYTSLQVLSPARDTYASGTVAFEDGDANPIPGLSDANLDNSGTVSLTGLNFSTAFGLPQFLVTLVGEQGTVGAVTVKLTWTGTDDSSCVGPNTTVSGGTSGAGQCGNAVFIAATGSGQHYASPTDLSVSPQLVAFYTSMVQTAASKDIGVRVLDYPATSVDALFAGLNQITARNRLDYLAKLRAKLPDNIRAYLAGEKQGVAALWGQYTSVRVGCPANTKIVLGGYSQGAMVVHEFLNELAATNDTAGKKAIIGSVLLADPERVKHSGVLELSDAAYSSYGVCDLLSLAVKCAAPDPLSDLKPPFLGTTVSVCSNDDPICDTSELIPQFERVWFDASARSSLVNLAKTVHDSYRYIPETRTAGKLIGRRVLRSS